VGDADSQAAIPGRSPSKKISELDIMINVEVM